MVSAWYYPASQQPDDINATLKLLSKHRGVVTSSPGELASERTSTEASQESHPDSGL